MANFPTTLDTLSNPTSTDLLENATAALDHDYQHATANDILEALEAKVGINSSAVTTSHDYKLSAVTGSEKALTSGTSTQTVSGLTLTSPQINFGSDANGDLIYRNGSGVTSRLAIGSTDQILAVQSGLPAWIANPSATAASATVAGIVELATTAETETGTDATRAVTPDGLHDMTTLAGAAWFLDEDTMSSDSATKTASQQSIKAYVDTTVGTSVVEIPRPLMPYSGAGTRALNNNVDGYVHMFSLSKKIVVNKITLNVTAVGAAGTINIGIFSADGQTRHISVTTASISGTGLVTTAVSAVTLPAGNYYMLLGSVSTANVTFSTWASLAPLADLRAVSSEPTISGTYTVTASTMPSTITLASISSGTESNFAFRLDN